MIDINVHIKQRKRVETLHYEEINISSFFKINKPIVKACIGGRRGYLQELELLKKVFPHSTIFLDSQTHELFKLFKFLLLRRIVND